MSTFARFIARILLLYYAVHFSLLQLSEKFKLLNVNLVNRPDRATPVMTWSCCSRQRRPHRVREFVTIESGAKNEVLDPVCPPPCLPSWSKPLSYHNPLVMLYKTLLALNFKGKRTFSTRDRRMVAVNYPKTKEY